MARSAAATNIGVDQPPLAEGIAPTIPTWRSVFAGVAIGVAAMMLLSVLWFALAFGSGWMQVRTELDWYLGGSGIFAMFVAGLTAAYLSGVRGTGSGVVHGTTVWATGVIFALVVGVPSVAGLIGLSPGELGVTEAGSIDPRDAAWPVFMSLLVGWAAAAFGGFMGGTAIRSDERAYVPVESLGADRRSSLRTTRTAGA